ncbi:MAG: hypothetical protein QM687_13430 [Ferruginibacter sp.]
MADRFEKYLQLSNRIVLCIVGFIVAVLLLLVSLRFIFGLLDSIPWFVYVFTLFIILVPPSIFITIFSVNIARTKKHPSAGIRIFSFVLLGAALIAWIYFFIADVITFFKTSSQEISSYNSYSVLYLAGSVALIFFVAIVQALSLEKEKDWIEKRKDRTGSFE